MDAVRVVQQFELTACRQYLVAFARPHIYRWHPDPRTYLKLSVVLEPFGKGMGTLLLYPYQICFEEADLRRDPRPQAARADGGSRRNHHRTLAPAVRPTLGAPLRQPSRRPPVFSTPSACSTRQSCRLPRSRSRRASAACAGSTPSSRTLPSPAGRGQAITPRDARRRHPERSSLPRADCAFPTAGMS